MIAMLSGMVGNMKDDIEARTFIEKVSKPIKEVADIVFDNVLSCIKDEKEMLEEEGLICHLMDIHLVNFIYIKF